MCVTLHSRNYGAMTECKLKQFVSRYIASNTFSWIKSVGDIGAVMCFLNCI